MSNLQGRLERTARRLTARRRERSVPHVEDARCSSARFVNIVIRLPVALIADP